jgi:hypothetical protein
MAIDRLYRSSAAEASAVVSAAEASVVEVIATNTDVATRYLQIFDTASVPADAQVPEICIAVPTGSTVSWEPRKEVYFPTGVCVCFSSTAATKTVAGAVGVFTVRGRAR